MAKRTTDKIDYYAVEKDGPYDFKMLAEMFVVDLRNELQEYRRRPIGKSQRTLEEITEAARNRNRELESSFVREAMGIIDASKKLDDEQLTTDKDFFDKFHSLPDPPEVEIKQGMTRSELLHGRRQAKKNLKEYEKRLRTLDGWKKEKEKVLQEMEDMLLKMEEIGDQMSVLENVLRKADDLRGFVKSQHQGLETRINRKTTNAALFFFFLAGIVSLFVSFLTSNILQQILPVLFAVLAWVAFSLFFRFHWSKRIQNEQKDEYWRIFNLVKIEVRKIRDETETKYEELILKLDEDVIEIIMSGR